jgi:hypothetical protein
MPEWIEAGQQSTAYLWHCHACDYRFEAVAYFEDAAGRTTDRGLISAMQAQAADRHLC